MAREDAYRKYQLTFNNPTEHGFSHEEIKTILESFSNRIYWCMCDEIGEKETLHTHLYVEFKNAVEFKTIHQRFYGAHIEAAHGSPRENRDYIRKEGKYLDDPKHETNLPNTFEEWGELPPDKAKRETQSAQVLAMINSGASDCDIIQAFPTWIKNTHSIEAARQAILEQKFREVFRKLAVYYIWGETGVGKTSSVMDKYGYPNVYRVTDYKNPFDGYQSEPVILFDEFRSDLPIKDMLKYLDGYPLKLPCRFQNRQACFETVYIASNIPFEQQYRDVQLSEPETWKAFQRRFESGGIFKMLPDSTDMPF